MKEMVSTCVEHFRSSINCALGPVPPFGALQAVLQSPVRTLGPDTPELRITDTEGSHSEDNSGLENTFEQGLQ